MLEVVLTAKVRPLNRKRGVGLRHMVSRDDLLPGTLYSKEDCGRDDPSMSPGSRS